MHREQLAHTVSDLSVEALCSYPDRFLFNPETGSIPGEIEQQAEQSCKNVAAILEAAGARAEGLLRNGGRQRSVYLRKSGKLTPTLSRRRPPQPSPGRGLPRRAG